MNFSGTLLKPVTEQRDRDEFYIDPAGVTFDPEMDYPLTWEFSYEPAAFVGTARISRADDGSLVVNGTIRGRKTKGKLAVGVSADRMDKPGTLHHCKLFWVSLTKHHQDPTQPWIEVER